MNIKKYNILNMLANILPSTKRKENIILYLNSLLLPLKTIHTNIFNSYYDEEIKLAKRSSQVPIFEKVLNEEMGFSYTFGSNNNIYITHNGEKLQPFYLYEASETVDPVYLYQKNEQKTYLYTYEEYTSEFDYEVNVTNGTTLGTGKINKIYSLVRLINSVDKRFTIKL